MAMRVVPFDAPLGAQVTGIDARHPLADEDVAALRDALDEHLVLILHHDEPLTAAQVVAFCERIGPLRPSLANQSRLPGFPGINRVSNRDDDGVVGTGGSGLVTWHSDLSFSAPLTEYVYLDALAATSSGGDTKWVNLVAAYNDLSPAMKDRIEDIGVHYRLRDGIDFDSYFKAVDNDAILGATETSLVHTNPRNGRKSVWPNVGPDFSISIDGMTDDETRAFLGELFVHSTQPKYQFRHTWRVGDAALWLNTQTMHEREAFPADEVRVLRHVNIVGVADPRQTVGAS